MAKHSREKLERELEPRMVEVLIEGGQLCPDSINPERILWTTKSPSAWPKWAKEIWAHRKR